LNINESVIAVNPAFARVGLTDISHAHFMPKGHTPFLILQSSSVRPARFAVTNWRQCFPPINWLPEY
jgi:hypothetical protein